MFKKMTYQQLFTTIIRIMATIALLLLVYRETGIATTVVLSLISIRVETQDISKMVKRN